MNITFNFLLQNNLYIKLYIQTTNICLKQLKLQFSPVLCQTLFDFRTRNPKLGCSFSFFVTFLFYVEQHSLESTLSETGSICNRFGHESLYILLCFS